MKSKPLIVNLAVLALSCAWVASAQAQNYNAMAAQYIEKAKHDPEFKNHVDELQETLPKYLNPETRSRVRGDEEQLVVAFLHKVGKPVTDVKPKAVKTILASSERTRTDTRFGYKVVGRKFAVIQANINGRKCDLFQLMDTNSGGLSSRAAVIVKRFEQVNRTTPRWWSTVAAGRHKKNGEYVVKCKGLKDGFLITADNGFARAEGKTPSELASFLATNIRVAFDPSKSEYAMRANEPDSAEEMRSKAMTLRISAEEEMDPAKAEALFKSSIEADKSYGEAYLGLAELLKNQGKKDEGKKILEDAIARGSLSDIDKDRIQQALNSY